MFQDKPSHSLHAFTPFVPVFSGHCNFHKDTLFSNCTATHSKRVDFREQVHGKNKSLRGISNITPVSRSGKALSLVLCRKRIIKERLCFLKRCVSPIWANHAHSRVNQSVLKKDDVFASARSVSRDRSAGQERYKNTYQLNNQRKFHRKSKNICKGFINTLMRDGSKLRYQSVLRKALLATLPDIS